jgi:hypothetical protein
MWLQAEADVYALLERNKEALTQVVDRLCAEPYELTGDEVRSIVSTYGDKDAIKSPQESAASFL